MRNPVRDRSRNLNREVWESSPFYGGVDVNSKNGATGNPWKDSKFDKNGKTKNLRRSATDIQITALPELKKARPWYSGVDSTVLQQNVKRLDTAYTNFFKGRGFPKFKNRRNFTSFTWVMGVKLQVNKIYLPKLGWMRFYNSRPIPKGFTIKACTVRKRQSILDFRF